MSGGGLRHIATEPADLSQKFEMDKRKSPLVRNKVKSCAGGASDSEASVESNSLSAESNNEIFPKTPPRESIVPTNKKLTRRGTEWEILEGLKDGQRFDKKPDVFNGYLHKKRKWPLKGWHKRYFVLDKGILIYAKGPGDIARGKIHGSVDIGLSVVSSKEKRKRIDIDAEEFIYHLKAKSVEAFLKWVDELKHHRLYRQHLLSYGNREPPVGHSRDSGAEDSPTQQGFAPPDSTPTRDVTLQKSDCSSPLAIMGTHSGSRLAAWVIDSSSNIDSIAKELNQISANIQQLGKILEQIESIPQIEAENCSFTGLMVPPSTPGLSSSSPSLPTRPQSLPGSGSDQIISLAPPDGRPSGTPDNQLREDFVILAKDIYRNLKSTHNGLSSERDRLKTALDSEGGLLSNAGSSSSLAIALRNSLNQALQQNTDLKARLARIHETADLSDISSVGPASEMQKPLRTSLSYSSSCVSASEFFDAEDYQSPENRRRSATSSEAGSITSEEGSVSSENSEVGTEYTPVQSIAGSGGIRSQCMTGRRTKLPVPRPDTEGLSLWNLLCKNIGKDLSQVSMPVALNEPLSMLQRMCEELEYSDLLDKAAELEDPYERMVYIAAFAVSSYGSSYFRAGSKPFNPLLGETYECIREDKGFRFVAEQVSHHPPVSVCFAESRNFEFWQDVRIKTKFWGKSMEFQPTGTVNVRLPKYDDFYQWNKVTTCVHNLFGGQRWVDQYGELRISSSNKITCKLTFMKASYWSAKRHEVFGVVSNRDGKVVRNLFGKWSEALYCGVAPSARCIWRPGTMPEEYELYYGFTRFAMELNELDQDMAKYLPITDTRFRPDQRLLEEGNLSAAENVKLQLEQNQRERRRRKEQEGIQHEPRWFRKTISPSGEEIWEYTHKYWELRKSPGFVNMQFEAIW